MKIWSGSKKGDDKIIAYFNDTIFKANPKDSEIENYIIALKTNRESAKGFFTIPSRYISEINMQEGKNYLEVIFRGDTEFLITSDESIKKEMFNFFTESIPGAVSINVKESKLKSARKPFIGLIILLAVFFWTLYLAIGMENGVEYDVEGQHYHSISGIMLVLASVGVVRLSLIFASLFLISFYTFFKKFKNPVVKNSLIFQMTKAR